MTAFSGAAAEAPTLPEDMFILAEKTDEIYRIKVTWADMSGETFYEVLRHSSAAPGPMIVTQSGRPALGQGWEVAAALAQDETEFEHGTFFAGTYAICGTAESEDETTDHEITCFGPSNFELPRQPQADATVDELQVFLRGIDRIGVRWSNSPNTVSARITLGRDGAVVEERQADGAPASAIFNGLTPNYLHEITVCVRNAEQTVANETCRSVPASTLPQVPGGVESISVVEPSEPTATSVTFDYDNTPEGAVSNILVNLIRGDAVVDSQPVFPDGAGRTSYTVQFGSLTPFTDYEVWVVPLNQSGVGPASGISFTTPEAVRIFPEAISGDSVMLRWSEGAPGTYGLERLEGGAWSEIASFVSLRPGPRSVVLDEASADKQVRLTWRLAWLRSASEVVASAPLASGAPELVSSRRSTAVTSAPGPGLSRADEPRRLATRYTVAFRATRGGLGTYELERRTSQGWRRVEGSTITAVIPNDQVRTLVDGSRPPVLVSAPQMTEHRVCRVESRAGLAQRACSAPSSLASAGFVRAE